MSTEAQKKHAQKPGSSKLVEPQSLGPAEREALRRDAGYRLIGESIKGLTVVNGGASVAALALLGQLAQRYPLTSVMIRDAGLALLALAIGTILPPAAAGAFAYYTFRPTVYLLWFGRCALIGAGLAFFVGLYFGWSVLEPLGFFNVELHR